MCTLALAFRVRQGTPLAVAANRDELYARPSAPPAIERGDVSVLAPRDLEGGGTWLGYSDRGLFVGITNRAGAAKNPGRVSRGLLVQEALRAPSAQALHERLRSLPGDRHNGFHLLYADRDAAFVTWGDGESVHQLPLRPGVHVFTERSFGAGQTLREPRIRAAVERSMAAAAPPTPRELRSLITFHGPEGAPFDGGCVHAEAFGYGTKSSFELVVDSAGKAAAIWTEGPPCTTPAQDLSALFASLRA